MNKINIAIDGPSGVGKSTIAKNISKRLNYLFVNTGLMYRAIAYFCIQNEINTNDEIEIEKILDTIQLVLLKNDEISLNNINVTKYLLDDIVSITASQIASYKNVRKFCVLKQQSYLANKGVVMEGRDIGSIVIPDAELKIFLSADPEIRANRRVIQLEKNDIKYDKNIVINNIKKRDELDKNRQNDPLVKMKDAIEIDTSHMTINEVEEQIYSLFLERIKNV